MTQRQAIKRPYVLLGDFSKYGNPFTLTAVINYKNPLGEV